MITIGDAFVTKDSHKAYKVIDKHHMFEGVWKCYPADKEPPYKDNLVDCFAGEFIEQCIQLTNN
jgi:hypothetical protein